MAIKTTVITIKRIEINRHSTSGAYEKTVHYKDVDAWGEYPNGETVYLNDLFIDFNQLSSALSLSEGHKLKAKSIVDSSDGNTIYEYVENSTNGKTYFRKAKESTGLFEFLILSLFMIPLAYVPFANWLTIYFGLSPIHFSHKQHKLLSDLKTNVDINIQKSKLPTIVKLILITPAFIIGLLYFNVFFDGFVFWSTPTSEEQDIYVVTSAFLAAYGIFGGIISLIILQTKYDSEVKRILINHSI
ncbi:hypothetical protein J3998_07225 [Thiomicrorhabdus sp. 6S2-11]|uniref:Uncharacterized protein n=1 Tax=Thiomicrorhabdus marina TaxID=2818442 RepID=A0ABS3Q5J1_9GAMM|nr:hypothetical protein [Thiomicrorhabdus marina]MBO1927368.1 hypothetical protein [Thiomicrorhabdus marina]